MKINKFFFYFFIFFYFSFSSSYSDNEIKVIDVDSLLENTNIGKKMINDLSSLNKKNLESLKPKEDMIKKSQNEINKQKNIISSEELKIKVDDYKKNVTSFQNEKKKLIENFNKQKQKKLNDFFNLVTPIINEYMEEKNLSIIFDKKNIFIAKSEVNITSDIINLINERLK